MVSAWSQALHRFAEQLLHDRIAARGERGGIADLAEAVGGERGEGAVDQVLAQAIAVAALGQRARCRRLDRRIQQRRLRLHRHLLARLLALVGQRDRQQAPHAARMLRLRFAAIGMHRQRHAVAVVVQGRIRRHAAHARHRDGNRRVGERAQSLLRHALRRMRGEGLAPRARRNARAIRRDRAIPRARCLPCLCPRHRAGAGWRAGAVRARSRRNRSPDSRRRSACAGSAPACPRTHPPAPAG